MKAPTIKTYQDVHDSGETRLLYEQLHKSVSAERAAAGLPVKPIVPVHPEHYIANHRSKKNNGTSK